MKWFCLFAVLSLPCLALAGPEEDARVSLCVAAALTQQRPQSTPPAPTPLPAARSCNCGPSCLCDGAPCDCDSQALPTVYRIIPLGAPIPEGWRFHSYTPAQATWSTQGAWMPASGGSCAVGRCR